MSNNLLRSLRPRRPAGWIILGFVGVLGLLLGPQLSSQTVSEATSMFCKVFPAAGTYLVSLPADNPIDSAEELCAAIGLNAGTVGQVFPDSIAETNTYNCVTSTCLTVAEPGSAACASSCFCIDPGEGFAIVTNGPGVLQIQGLDLATQNIPLAQPGFLGSATGSQLISLPYFRDPSLVAADDLRQSINAVNPSADANITTFLSPAGPAVTYSGLSVLNNFALQPSEAYQIQVASTTNWIATSTVPLPPFPTCNDLNRRYEINGTGTSSTFSWQLLDGTSNPLCQDPVAAVNPLGGTAVNLTTNFVDSINDLTLIPTCAASLAVADQLTTMSNLFDVTLQSNGPPQLIVDTPPLCLVGPAPGCTYNPTILQYTNPPHVNDGDTGVPVLVDKLDPAGSDLRVWWDSNVCIEALDYQIISGGGSQLPSTLGGLYNASVGECQIGSASPHNWLGTPDASLDPSQFIWFIVQATDGVSMEGSWGANSSGERTGAGVNGSSAQCGMTSKDLSNTCQ